MMITGYSPIDTRHKGKQKGRRLFRAFFLCAAFTLLHVSITGCVTVHKWKPGDFARYAKSPQGTRVFPMKYFGTEVNTKMNICCYDYIDSRYTIDALPLKEIKKYMEKKYGIRVDVSEFEKSRVRGYLKAQITTRPNGDKMIVYNREHLSLDGASITAGLLQSASWIALNWSEYKPKVGTMDFRDKLDKGKNDQMQVFLEINPLGGLAYVQIRIRE